MPVRVPRKMCVIYKRTDEEKKVHKMGKELEETKSKLESATRELGSTKKELRSLTDKVNKLLASSGGDSGNK